MLALRQVGVGSDTFYPMGLLADGFARILPAIPLYEMRGDLSNGSFMAVCD